MLGANDEGNPLQPVRGPEILEIVDLPDPHAGPGQIRVAVRAAGINPTDWKLRRGLMGSEHVVTITDFEGAQQHGVTFSRGDDGRAVHALAEIGELIESSRFSLPVAQTFPLAQIAAAHRISEDGHVRGKLVLEVS